MQKRTPSLLKGLIGKSEISVRTFPPARCFDEIFETVATHHIEETGSGFFFGTAYAIHYQTHR